MATLGSLDLGQMSLYTSNQVSNCDPVVQASAAGVANAINYAITKVSGTAAMTAVRVPKGFRGTFCLIPTAAFTGATGGAADFANASYDQIPIGLAFTAVIGKALFLTVGPDNLLYPSY